MVSIVPFAFRHFQYLVPAVLGSFRRNVGQRFNIVGKPWPPILVKAFVPL